METGLARFTGFSPAKSCNPLNPWIPVSNTRSLGANRTGMRQPRPPPQLPPLPIPNRLRVFSHQQPLTLFLLSSFSRLGQTQDCARASLALGWLVTGLWPEDLPSLVNPTTHQSAFPAPVLLYHLSELTGLLCGVAARQSRRGFQPRAGGWAQEAGWRGAKGAHDSRDRPPPRCARPREVENLACLACRRTTSVRLFARDGMTRRSLPDSL